MNIYSNINNIPNESLEDGQVYIYVIENEPQHNIKIGKSSNVQQRFKSLSGSNGGSNKLIKFAVSQSTYLYTIEKMVHDHFDYARLNGEWFDGNKISFNEVVDFIDSLFNDKSYNRLNEVRKQYTLEKQKSKEEN